MGNQMLNEIYQNSHLFTLEELHTINQNVDLFSKVYTLSKVMKNFDSIFYDEDGEESEV